MKIERWLRPPVGDSDPGRWERELAEVLVPVGSWLARAETRRQAASLVRGLLAGLPRVNCQTIAEHAGHAGPDTWQHLLAGAVWDQGGVRDDRRAYVVGHLSAPADGRDLGVGQVVLVADETGDLPKGTAPVGVQRQYTGPAGRIENSQVAVYLAYATGRGQAFIDRELYLPRAWTDDPARCAAAGVPGDVEFSTKPALAAAMLARVLDAGVEAGWFAGDAVYGSDPARRAFCRARGLGQVLAVA